MRKRWVVAGVGASVWMLVAACSSDEFVPGGTAGADGGGAAGSAGSSGAGGTAGSGGGGSGGTAGSSGSGGSGGGGGAGDAGSDAYVPVFETVTVVDDADQPMAGVTVFANQADGTLFDEAITDSAGSAKVDVPPGGLVGLARKFNDGGATTQHVVVTYAGAQQGGTVNLIGDFNQRLHAQAMGDITVKTTSLPAGTAQVDLFLPCLTQPGLTGTQWTVPSYRTCFGATTYDVVAVARNASGQIIGSATSFANPYNPGQAVTLNVSFSAGYDEIAMSATNAPPGSTTEFSITGTRKVTPGLEVEDEKFAITGTTPQATLRQPKGGLDGYLLRDVVSWPDGPVKLGVERRRVTTSFSPSSVLAFPFELAQVTTVSDADVTDPARPKWTWQISNTGTQGKCVIGFTAAQLGAQDSLIFLALSGFGTSGSFQMPQLPASHADSVPKASTVFPGVNVLHLDPAVVKKSGCMEFLSSRASTSDVSATLAKRGNLG